MTDQIDPKVIERVQKLMNLARDGGATEAEADVAMNKAQQIMAEYNLSMASIEKQEGKIATDRKRQSNSKKLMYVWKRELLESVAKVSFCHLIIKWGATRSGESIAQGFDLIGRESNIVGAQNLYDYLMHTIERLVVDEFGKDPRDRFSRDAHSYRKGLSEGLSDRLVARYHAIVREQERKAREEAARARHPGAASNSTALVLMSEYASSEADLNNDFIRGWEPGTTARRRAEEEAKAEERAANRRAKVERWIAEGISEDVAHYMSYGYSREEAEKICKPKERKPETEAQRRKRERSERAYREREWAREQREARKYNQHYLNKGMRDAENIGLDDQIDEEKQGRLS